MTKEERQRWESLQRFAYRKSNLERWQIELLKQNNFDFNSQISTDVISFEKAKTFVHALGLKSWKDWYEYCKSGNKPQNIPISPDAVYKNCGWINIKDWLGYNENNGYKREYLSFEEARQFVRMLKLKSQLAWAEYSKTNRPENIPGNPPKIYKDKWISWNDWMGYENKYSSKNRAFWPYKKARSFVQTLGLKSWIDWQKYSQSGERPDKIPSDPNKIYKSKGWISLGDFLGCEMRPRQRIYLSFHEAKKEIQKLKLKSQSEWKKYSQTNRPDYIPSNPPRVYKDEWINWYDWLGK